MIVILGSTIGLYMEGLFHVVGYLVSLSLIISSISSLCDPIVRFSGYTMQGLTCPHIHII